MLTLRLSTNWTCAYVEAGHQTPTHREPVAQLDGWHFDTAQSPRTAWLEHHFDLHPTDECVQYFLHIATAPAGAQVIVNEENLGSISAPCDLDVTAYVSLDDNRIAFRVAADADRDEPGAFGDVRLQAIPCE
ncbi:MAG: hypothetical protein IT320_10305 [Anaerolineae bacterium]|nr:hypothetical protein [Anaerolineae bacterium]